MIPLRDTIPSRTTPLVTVLIIVDQRARLSVHAVARSLYAEPLHPAVCAWCPPDFNLSSAGHFACFCTAAGCT